MEYREPSRIVASERRAEGLIEDADSPSRLRRFEFVRPKGRLEARRLVAALLLLVSVALVVFYLGRQAVDAAVGWLHGQPRYQLRFDEIQLVKPPPAWFRGGAPAFLERVRQTANEPEVLSLLELEPGRIERAFKLFPWVKTVESIAFPPRTIEVRLAYNEPAAVVQIGTVDQVVLDRRAIVLPVEDIDTAKVGRTILINGRGIVAPPSNRLGLIWKTETPDRPELAQVDRYVVQAAKLAGFLLKPQRQREAESAPSLRILAIIASGSMNERWLFIQNAENVLILWGEAPGDERPGDPSAEEKWRILVDKAKAKAIEPQNKPGYWVFSNADLRYRESVRKQ